MQSIWSSGLSLWLLVSNQDVKGFNLPTGHLHGMLLPMGFLIYKFCRDLPGFESGAHTINMRDKGLNMSFV